MNFAPSTLVSKIQESATLALSSKAKALKAEGKPVINFGAGEPDFNTDPSVIDAAFEAAKAGATKYTPVPGTPAARKAVAERLSADYGVKFEQNQVLLSNGAKQAIFHALQVMLEPGDEVLIPSPYWVSFPEMVKLVGAVPVPVPSQDGKITREAIEAKITPKTKALILNSPNNPSGKVFNKQEVQDVIDAIEKYPIWLLSDDTYYGLCYEPAKFVSALQLREDFKERTIVVGSTSKSYAMTGWRLGWALGPEAMIKAMSKIQGQVSSGPSSVSQAATEMATTKAHGVAADFKKRFNERRELIKGCLSKIPGVSWIEPEGAFYIFVKLSEVVKNQSVSDFAMDLLQKHYVCVIPGEPFGEPDYIRLSYALGEAQIEEGVGRIGKAINEL